SDEEGIHTGDGGDSDRDLRAAMRDPGETEEGGECGEASGDPGNGTGGKQPDNQRPHEVKLFFDGERPEVSEIVGVAGSPVFLPKIQPIGEIAVIEPAIGGLRQNGRDSAGMQKDAGENYGREYDVIQRKNAKDTAGIEAAEIVCGGAGIEEDAGDEKSGEDEEE